MEISEIQDFFFDLDKTIWNWDEPVIGAADLVHTIYDKGKNAYFFTDNSLMTAEEYAEKLESMNIPAKPQQILTPDVVLTRYLQKNSIGSVYALGNSSFIQSLEDKGVSVNQHANHVVVGFDRQFSYNKLKRARKIAENGGKVFVCSTEKTFRTSSGEQPHQLAINNAIETFAETKSFGKESDEYLNTFTSFFSFLPSRAMVVGDRLEDVQLGNSMGATTAAVMSGDIDRNALRTCRPIQRPNIGVSNLNKLKRKINNIKFK